MHCLDISAKIPIDKKIEFDQSKIEFINGLYKHKGYVSCKEDISQYFNVIIKWQSEEELDNFTSSNLFHYFSGALKAISSDCSVTTYELLQKTIN